MRFVWNRTNVKFGKRHIFYKCQKPSVSDRNAVKYLALSVKISDVDKIMKFLTKGKMNVRRLLKESKLATGFQGPKRESLDVIKCAISHDNANKHRNNCSAVVHQEELKLRSCLREKERERGRKRAK